MQVRHQSLEPVSLYPEEMTMVDCLRLTLKLNPFIKSWGPEQGPRAFYYPALGIFATRRSEAVNSSICNHGRI